MLLAGDVELAFAPTIIDENGGQSVGTVSLSTPVNEDVTFDIAEIGGANQFDLPPTVTIPALATSATFVVTAIDNDFEGGGGTGTIEVSNDALGSDSAGIFVPEDDFATLSAVLDGDGTVREGEFTFLRFELSIPRTFQTQIEVSVSDSTENSAFNFGEVDIFASDPDQGILNLTGALAIFGLTDNLVDGDQESLLTISANGIDSFTVPITTIDVDSFDLGLTVDPIEITEEETATGTVSITTASETDVIVSLVTDDTEISVPSTVTIPAFATSAEFPITGVDDELVDGDQLVSITASTDGSADASADLTVIDIDTTSLLLDLDAAEVSEGGAIAGTVSLTTPLTVDTVVAVAVDDASEASVAPTEVTILAGESSASFTVSGEIDSLVDGDQIATVSVASGDLSDSATVTVVDADAAVLSLAIVDTLISEGEVATGTVSISTPSTDDIVVSITSSDASEIGVPAEVTILAGSTSADFSVTALIDGLVDGDQSAIVTVTDGATSDSVEVDVVDADTAVLSLEIAADSISENGGVAAGVATLSTPSTTDTVVTLAVDDDSEVSIPAQVIIPAFATTAQITVTAIDDDVVDGDQLVTITASSAFGDAVDTLTVTDDDEVVVEEPVTGVTLSDDGTIEVVGSDGVDTIIIRIIDGQVRVGTLFDSGSFEAFEFAESDVVDVTIDLGDGDDQLFVSSGVALPIQVDGGLGNDFIATGSGNDVVTDLFGDNQIQIRSGDDTVITGDGNDFIIGGGGNDVINAGDGNNQVFGGSGDDVIITGDGSDNVISGSGDDAVASGGGQDRLFGSSGRDILIGGSESDILFGSSGDDILIGGITTFDNDAEALALLLAQWASDDSFEDRLEALTTGSGDLNGIQLVAGETVTDDEAVDVIFGGSGENLFFADLDGSGGEDDFVFGLSFDDELELI